MTQSKIDSFVHCKFAYQMQYELKLREQQKVAYDPRDVGNFIHVLLERFFKELSTAFDEGMVIGVDRRREIVDRLVDEYIDNTCGNLDGVSKRMFALFARLRRHGMVFINSICDEFENSDFSPRFFELSISDKKDNAIPPYRVKLSDGSSAYITGQIDRVDTYEVDGNTYFRVVDYKTGSKAFSVEDLERGLNLQMFLYMFSIMENRDEFCRLLGTPSHLVPAGVLYYLARLSPVEYDGVVDYDNIEQDVIDSIERQGMLLDNKDILLAMSKAGNDKVLPRGVTTSSKKNKESAVFSLESLSEIEATINRTIERITVELKSGKADAVPMRDSKDPCSYCKMKVICRNNDKGGVVDNE